MEIPHEVAQMQRPKTEETVELHVNEKPVIMQGHQQTGLAIKEAAIAQLVKIQIDFLLYKLQPHNPNKLIADNDETTITKGSCFHAIADDDNS